MQAQTPTGTQKRTSHSSQHLHSSTACCCPLPPDPSKKTLHPRGRTALTSFCSSASRFLSPPPSPRSARILRARPPVPHWLLAHIRNAYTSRRRLRVRSCTTIAMLCRGHAAESRGAVVGKEGVHPPELEGVQALHPRHGLADGPRPGAPDRVLPARPPARRPPAPPRPVPKSAPNPQPSPTRMARARRSREPLRTSVPRIHPKSMHAPVDAPSAQAPIDARKALLGPGEPPLIHAGPGGMVAAHARSHPRSRVSSLLSWATPCATASAPSSPISFPLRAIVSS